MAIQCKRPTYTIAAFRHSILFGLVLLVLLLQSCTPVQAQPGVESRVSRLESEFVGLRSQITQLQSQLSSSGRVRSSQPAPAIPPRSSRPVLSDDPMFDRLATLVIELKERLNAVETRLDALERQAGKKS